MTDAAGPEPARVLAAVRARARALNAGALRARVRAAGLTGLAEADARRPRTAGEWTVAQVVDHVAQSTVRGAEEMRHLLAGVAAG